MSLKDDFLRDLEAAGDRLGVALDVLSDEMRLYTATRITHLSTTVAEPGHIEVARREGLNILGKASGRAVTAADATDAELLGFATGGLLFLARMLTVGLE